MPRWILTALNLTLYSIWSVIGIILASVFCNGLPIWAPFLTFSGSLSFVSWCADLIFFNYCHRLGPTKGYVAKFGCCFLHLQVAFAYFFGFWNLEWSIRSVKLYFEILSFKMTNSKGKNFFFRKDAEINLDRGARSNNCATPNFEYSVV